MVPSLPGPQKLVLARPVLFWAGEAQEHLVARKQATQWRQKSCTLTTDPFWTRLSWSLKGGIDFLRHGFSLAPFGSYVHCTNCRPTCCLLQPCSKMRPLL